MRFLFILVALTSGSPVQRLRDFLANAKRFRSARLGDEELPAEVAVQTVLRTATDYAMGVRTDPSVAFEAIEALCRSNLSEADFEDGITWPAIALICSRPQPVEEETSLGKRKQVEEVPQSSSSAAVDSSPPAAVIQRKPALKIDTADAALSKKAKHEETPRLSSLDESPLEISPQVMDRVTRELHEAMDPLFASAASSPLAQAPTEGMEYLAWRHADMLENGRLKDVLYNVNLLKSLRLPDAHMKYLFGPANRFFNKQPSGYTSEEKSRLNAIGSRIRPRFDRETFLTSLRSYNNCDPRIAAQLKPVGDKLTEKARAGDVESLFRTVSFLEMANVPKTYLCAILRDVVPILSPRV